MSVKLCRWKCEKVNGLSFIVYKSRTCGANLSSRTTHGHSDNTHTAGEFHLRLQQEKNATRIPVNKTLPTASAPWQFRLGHYWYCQWPGYIWSLEPKLLSAETRTNVMLCTLTVTAILWGGYTIVCIYRLHPVHYGGMAISNRLNLLSKAFPLKQYSAVFSYYVIQRALFFNNVR